MGKTSLALNIAANVLRESENRAVLFFSLEMAETEIIRRLLCSEARVDSHRFTGGWLNSDERARLMSTVNRLPDGELWIDDTAQHDVTDFYSRVRRFAAQHPLGLVVVDYLQLMTSKEHVKAGRTAEVGAISRRLKLIAKEFRVPVLALSQLSRAADKRADPRPQLSDLRESGSIEQDADNVLFVFREEVYKTDREDLHGIAEIIIGKQRNGPIGKHRVAFVHALTRFENLAEDVGMGYGGTDEE
jgi:replicative DNA helicase